MDEKRFDAWTRRQFGLGAGGLAASLVGLQGLDDAEGKTRRHKHKAATQKNKHKNKGKKGKGPKCKKAGTGGCKTSRPDCCAGLSCQAVPGFGGVRCCADVGARCSRDQQCCSGVC